MSGSKDSVSHPREFLGLFCQQMCGLAVGKDGMVSMETVIQSSVVLVLLYL